VKKMTKAKVLGVTVAVLALTAASAVPAVADFASQTGDQYGSQYQYDSQYCTWETVGPIVQGEPPNQECVAPGAAVPL